MGEGRELLLSSVLTDGKARHRALAHFAEPDRAVVGYERKRVRVVKWGDPDSAARAATRLLVWEVPLFDGSIGGDAPDAVAGHLGEPERGRPIWTRPHDDHSGLVGLVVVGVQGWWVGQQKLREDACGRHPQDPAVVGGRVGPEVRRVAIRKPQRVVGPDDEAGRLRRRLVRRLGNDKTVEGLSVRCHLYDHAIRKLREIEVAVRTYHQPDGERERVGDRVFGDLFRVHVDRRDRALEGWGIEAVLGEPDIVIVIRAWAYDNRSRRRPARRGWKFVNDRILAEWDTWGEIPNLRDEVFREPHRAVRPYDGEVRPAADIACLCAGAAKRPWGVSDLSDTLSRRQRIVRTALIKPADAGPEVFDAAIDRAVRLERRILHDPQVTVGSEGHADGADGVSLHGGQRGVVATLEVLCLVLGDHGSLWHLRRCRYCR